MDSQLRAKQGRALEPGDPCFRNLRGRDPRAPHSSCGVSQPAVTATGTPSAARCTDVATSRCFGTRGSRPAFVLARASGPRRRGWLCPIRAVTGARVGVEIVAASVRERHSAVSDGRLLLLPSSVSGAAVDGGCRNHLVKRNCAAVRARRWLLGARWGSGPAGGSDAWCVRSR